MRKISSRTTKSLLKLVQGLALITGIGATTPQILAQSTIVQPSQSSIYNQNGMYMPNTPLPHGQDEISGASGVSCRSAISGNGPLLDVGVMGSADVFDRDTGAMYGRIVYQMGKKPKRVDCNRLYELEIERMKLELELMRSGLGMGDISAVH